MKRKKNLRPMTAKNVDKWLRAGQPGKHLDRGVKGPRGSVPGLILDIRGPHAASWVLRYQINKGPTRHFGIGSARTFSLGEARERARTERKRLADGVDPLTVRRSERAAARVAAQRRLTFAEAAERWLEKARREWSSPKHAVNTEDAMAKWVLPHIGKLDVAAIDTKDVMRVLQQPVNGATLWVTHTTTASRIANQLRQIIDWATAAEHRPKGANPATWSGHLDQLLPKPGKVTPVVAMPAMPYADVPALMTELAAREGIAALALRFLVMTTTRVSETTGATHSEINFEAATWTIPATRMKARREHVVPLAPQVVELLKGLPTEDGNKFLFLGASSGEGVSGSAIRMLLRRLGHDVVAHGFRSSFSTWAHERTGHSNHEIELSLAHSIGSEVERAYRRTDLLAKRRKLMEAWATYVTSPPVVQKAGSNVRPMRGRPPVGG
jgi:integrase